MAKVIINAGHGGSDTGVIYKKRYEKDDNLKLALEVGQILTRKNIDVEYLRTTDMFISPITRVDEINNSNADLLIAIHRGSGPMPNTESGVNAFLTDGGGLEEVVAVSILNNLHEIGFHNNGIDVRSTNYILRESQVPSVALYVGYIDNVNDNELFDNNFDQIANAIAEGILEVLEVSK